MTEIRSIGVLSMAKMFAAISLIVGFIVAVLTVFLGLIAMAAMPFLDISPLAHGGCLLMALVAIFVMTLVYAVAGFLAGAIVAVIYNIAAGIFGGVDITLVTPLVSEETDEDIDRSYD
ncbi:hypothetical protein AZH53_10390 [Methanomicrobiaceae archaeon CYW5]|uniref:hypothetical protein n=1 Tax=Methanovulcanius yangii TaxID=1789227 RepID=UPI0029CA27C5|nr:hypothetical protein [Methanovulcanius yangii]MBT8508813.1 hypothetical protein [Methanovulcanius yangii]